MAIKPHSLRIIFMGTPDFAVGALKALHAAGHQIVAVYTQPPRPAGRGMAARISPVQAAAEALKLEVRSPVNFKAAEDQQAFDDLKADIAVVAAYGLILPLRILQMPKRGCLNIHASLLPRWRGAAPIQRAILAGDASSGVTIMQMEAGLDTGPMLMQEEIKLTVHTTAQSLHDDLARVGAGLIVATLDKLAMPDGLKATPQPELGVRHAAKLTRDDGKIDWDKPAIEIDRQLRALTPWPGCTFTLNGETVKILELVMMPHMAGPPGQLLDDEFTVACGEQAVRLTKLQRSGKNPCDGASLLRGMRLLIGSKL